MKLTGKIKSIPVKEVTEGMQALYGVRVCKVNYVKGNFTHMSTSDGILELAYPKLKTLVVEYEVMEHGLDDQPKGLITQTLPLKYSQWQAAIDAGEVDSDKSVEFEVLNTATGTNEFDVLDIDLAVIIPQKKRMYSEEEVVSALVDFTGTSRENARIWFEQNVK